MLAVRVTMHRGLNGLDGTQGAGDGYSFGHKATEHELPGRAAVYMSLQVCSGDPCVKQERSASSDPSRHLSGAAELAGAMGKLS